MIWRALEWKLRLYFMTIWNIFRSFGIIYDLLVKFVVIWYIFTFWYVWTKKNLTTLIQTIFKDVLKQIRVFLTRIRKM
jgi:hypothetical protein